MKADPVVGDFDGDGKDDVAVLGGTFWNSVRIAWSRSYRDTTDPGTPLAPGVVDPPTAPGVPVARFEPAQWPNSAFANLAANPNAKPVAGDFNGDGKDDIAIVGLPQSMPLALSNGNGFTVKTIPVAPISWFLSQVHTPGAQVVTADFNGDHRDDIALVGGRGWTSVPTAFATTSGCPFACPQEFTGFTVTNEPSGIAERADDIEAPLNTPPTVKVVAGDVNADGRADLTVLGSHGPFGDLYPFVPVAYSQGTTGFPGHWHDVSNVDAQLTAILGATTDIRPVAADVNGDGRSDLTMTGGMNFVGVTVNNTNDDYTFVDKYIP